MKTSCERTRLPGRPADAEIAAVRAMIDQDLEHDTSSARWVPMEDPHCHICLYPGTLLRLMMSNGTPVLVCPNCEGTT